MEFGGDPLAWLLSIEDSGIFLSDYYSKLHFHAKNDNRDRFKDLLSFEELDHIVGTYGLKFPEIRLARSDQDVPLREYTYRGDIADPLRVARLFAEGATVIFRGLQDRHKNIQLLCSALARQATIQTQANIYLTPPHSQGFNIHWDTHDVLIIQIEGSKTWRIYDGGITLPIRSQKFDSNLNTPGEVIDEFVLHAGEVLYIPRGVMHAASSTDQTSLHITLGLLGYSWAELMIDIMAEHTEKNIEWRENLPFGYGHQNEQGVPFLREKLKDRLRAFIDNVDIDAVVHAHLWQVHAASRPRENHFLSNALLSRDLTGDTTVVKIPGLSMHMEARGDRVYLSGGAREISFPIVAQNVLKSVLNESPVCIKELDPSIDIESRKTVVSRLLREGILKRSD